MVRLWGLIPRVALGWVLIPVQHAPNRPGGRDGRGGLYGSDVNLRAGNGGSFIQKVNRSSRLQSVNKRGWLLEMHREPRELHFLVRQYPFRVVQSACRARQLLFSGVQALSQCSVAGFK